MSLAEKLQGTPRKRQGPKRATRQAHLTNTKKPDIVIEPRKKPKTTKQCFEDPILNVDVKTGEVLINRLWE